MSTGGSAYPLCAAPSNSQSRFGVCSIGSSLISAVRRLGQDCGHGCQELRSRTLPRGPMAARSGPTANFSMKRLIGSGMSATYCLLSDRFIPAVIKIVASNVITFWARFLDFLTNVCGELVFFSLDQSYQRMMACWGRHHLSMQIFLSTETGWLQGPMFQ
jgi:hypothetical protein